MSMLSQLRNLWGYQDRIRRLEARNARLAESRDRNDAKRAKFKRERDAAIAERDATAKLLEETTASLIDAKRRNGHLLDEFGRLAGMFRKKLADLAAALELLDEAGDEIKRLNLALKLAGKERDDYLTRLRAVASVVGR